MVTIPTTGNYIFGTRSDDGSLIYVDGNQVANNNFYQGMTTRTVTVNNLQAGSQHTVDIYLLRRRRREWPAGRDGHLDR